MVFLFSLPTCFTCKPCRLTCHLPMWCSSWQITSYSTCQDLPTRHPPCWLTLRLNPNGVQLWWYSEGESQWFSLVHPLEWFMKHCSWGTSVAVEWFSCLFFRCLRYQLLFQATFYSCHLEYPFFFMSIFFNYAFPLGQQVRQIHIKMCLKYLEQWSP